MGLGLRNNLLPRIVGIAAAVITVIPIVFGVTSNATAAMRDNSATKAWMTREVGRLLAHNPGSRQISANSIQARDGAIISAIPDSASGRCTNGNLCLFWDTVKVGFWQGDMLTLGPYNGCRYYNLNNIYGSNGRPWANQTSAIDNPDPRPGAARFGHNGKYVFSVPAGHYYQNLTKDYGSNGHVMNDYITDVRTC